jgi:hypothetical protein
MCQGIVVRVRVELRSLVTTVVTFSDEAIIRNANNRAGVIERITQGNGFPGMRKAIALLRRLMRKAEAQRLDLDVAAIADEIACLIICEPAVQWSSQPCPLSDALPYLTKANQIEKRYRNLKGLVGARKTLIGTIESRYGKRLKDQARRRRGLRLMREGIKAMEVCNMTKVNLSRLQALMGSIQWCNDNTDAGDAEGAATALTKINPRFEPTIANIVNNCIFDPEY